MKKVSLTLRPVLLAGAAMLLASTSQAAEPINYVGGNISLYTRYSIDCATGADCNRSPSWNGKVFAGTALNDMFGVEALLFGLGSAKGSLQQGSSQVAGAVNMRGLGVVGTVALLNEKDYSLKAKLGLGYVRSSASLPSGSQTDNSFQPLGGLGFSYALSKQVSLNADWDMVRGKYGDGTQNAQMFSVGASYKF